MKKMIMTFCFLLMMNLSLFAGRGNFSLLTEVQTDSIQLGIGYFPVSFLNLDLSFGPAMEYADLRLNDWMAALSLSFIFFKRFPVSPYLRTGGQLHIVKIPEKYIAVPAVLISCGFSWKIKERHIIYLEGGWRWGRRNILLSEEDNYAVVEYRDDWEVSPQLHIALGYRFLF